MLCWGGDNVHLPRACCSVVAYSCVRAQAAGSGVVVLVEELVLLRKERVRSNLQSQNVLGSKDFGVYKDTSTMNVRTKGKCDGRPAAVVHVPAEAYIEEFLEAKTAAFETFDRQCICWGVVWD